MTTVTPVNGSNVKIEPKGSGNANAALDQSAFLRLMTTQLQQQDPFNPMDNTQMVAQMAQFSSVAGISEMNTALRSIADQIATQTQLLADIKAATSAAANPAPSGV